jgi:hypothetical protein
MSFNVKTRAETLAVALAAALNAGSWLWVALSVPRSAFPVIVSYNVFWGQDFLGERPMIFTAPLLGALVLVVNAALLRAFKGDRYAFIRWALAGGTLILQCFVLAVSWFVVAANT